ncbi:MAG: hypothetical protein J4G05_04815 [Chlorobi bacterium]|nr:hypothetical protein [Chlorobiota bacterium]
MKPGRFDLLVCFALITTIFSLNAQSIADPERAISGWEERLPTQAQSLRREHGG